MTIYIDIVFLENLLLNYIILIATALIGNSKMKYFKFLFASIFGSCYAILNYIIEISTFQNFLIKLFISSFMIYISFENKKIITFFKNFVMFYLTSLTFGGAAFMLLFFISPESIDFENGHFIGIYPIEVSIYGCVLGFLIIAITTYLIRSKQKNMLCDIEIVYRKKKIQVKTLIDSGNLLKEPITNQSVIIVEKSILKEIIDIKILDDAISMINGNLIGQMSDEIYKYKFRVIPFSSLGNENGMLIGFKPTYIKILSTEEYIRKDVIIGIYDGKLSNTNLYYTGLIGTECLEKEDIKNEIITSA